MPISGQCKSCGNQTLTRSNHRIKINRTGEIRPVGTLFCIPCLSGAKTSIVDPDSKQTYFYVWCCGPAGIYLVDKYPSFRMAESIAKNSVRFYGGAADCAWVTDNADMHSEKLFDVSKAKH